MPPIRNASTRGKCQGALRGERRTGRYGRPSRDEVTIDRQFRVGREDVGSASGSGPASAALAWYGRSVGSLGSRSDLRIG